MKIAGPNASKGAISSTTVLVAVSVIFTFLAIGVSTDLVVGSFTEAANMGDREWIKGVIASNAKGFCDSASDSSTPIAGNYTRDLSRGSGFKVEERGYYTYFQVTNSSTGAVLIDVKMYQTSGVSCPDVKFNGTGTSSSDSISFNPDKPVNVRLFYDHSATTTTIQVLQS